MSDPIKELWVWVVQQANGVEKIANPWISQGYYPLITSSNELAKIRMLDLAKNVEQETGCPTKLVQFVREDKVIELKAQVKNLEMQILRLQFIGRSRT